jgi:hypothetical protein
MWHPDHRLRFGLETGYLNLYNYKINSENIGGKLRLTAVPLLIVWSMQIGKRINIFAGSGTYFIKSRLDYAGHSEAGNLSLGWMAAASYNFNISNSFSITPELKWFDASESGHQSLNLQMLFAWKFYKW